MSVTEVSFEYEGRRQAMGREPQMELDLDLPDGEIGDALLQLQAARIRRKAAEAAAMLAKEELKEATAVESDAVDELCEITERCRR